MPAARFGTRSGLVLGEGAGAVVLETETHARKRGATILAELAGAGLCADAGDIVSPAEDGMATAMSLCLDDAGLNPADVDYINAHGTATKANDASETAAIRTSSAAMRTVFRYHQPSPCMPIVWAHLAHWR